jgi:hypothetical protein
MSSSASLIVLAIWFAALGGVDVQVNTELLSRARNIEHNGK